MTASIFSSMASQSSVIVVSKSSHDCQRSAARWVWAHSACGLFRQARIPREASLRVCARRHTHAAKLHAGLRPPEQTNLNHCEPTPSPRFARQLREGLDTTISDAIAEKMDAVVVERSLNFVSAAT